MSRGAEAGGGGAATEPLRVLVTGATGFVGRALMQWLRARGHSTVGLQRREPGPGVILLDLEEGVRRPDRVAVALAAAAPDVVVHLAWGMASNPYRNHRAHYELNLRFTQLLVDAVAARPTCHFVGVGSQAEYGVHADVLRPDTPCVPLHAYGDAKRLSGEYALARLGARGCWLRLLTAYGPGDDPNKFLPYLVGAYQRGEVAVLSPGDQRWDWLHVDDAAAAIGRCAEGRVAGLHVLASGEVASMREIALQLREIALGRGLSPPMPHFGGRPYNPNELMLLAGDATSLREAAGWAPDVPLAMGLAGLFG